MSGDPESPLGDRMVVDTSALVDFAKGDEVVAEVLWGRQLHISVITEIEFLSWPGMAEERMDEAHAYLNEFSSGGIGDFVRDYAAFIKRTYKLKLPDAVIAATAMHLNAPLITRDKGFNKVAHLIDVRVA